MNIKYIVLPLRALDGKMYIHYPGRQSDSTLYLTAWIDEKIAKHMHFGRFTKNTDNKLSEVAL